MKKIISLSLILTFFCAATASANPSFSHTVNGNIRIEENNGVYTIYASDRAIGVFNSFGNNMGEIINSLQGSPDFTALFRVAGTDPSIFNGIFNANSHIFLINPNGIVFGHGSQINAASLVASTLDMSDSDFLSQNYRFQQDSLKAPAAVINQGTINAGPDGYVVLLGGAVSNEGTINANGGSVALAAGNRASIAIDGAGFISVEVDEAVLQNVYDLQGKQIYDGVSNSGEIHANGGYVTLTAKAVEGVFDNVINHSGVIEATTVGEKNGKVVFDGGQSGIVRISGDIDARGKNAGEKGGDVKILGEKVGLFDHGSIDASGQAGGGTVLFGGDYRGQGGVPTSDYAFVGQDASIRADALNTGNGGKVIVWSDLVTRVGGTISAKGGQNGGDGGFIETSSHEILEVSGARINANAVNGNVGVWLMDPRNVTIAGATAGGSFNGNSPNVFTPTADDATVDAATIEASLNGGTSVTINTGSTGAQAGNITVTNSITKSAGSGAATLTLTAANNITVNNTITATTGTLGVTLTAGGNVDINSAITTNGGAFSSTGVDFDNTGGAIATGTGNFTVNQTGNITLGANVTSGGNIDIDSTGTTAVTAGTVVTGGGAGRTFTIDAAGLTVGNTAGGALRQTSTGTMALTATGATNITLADNAINIADGALTLTAGGNVNAAAAGDNTAEIDADGNVTITADGIGNVNQVEITGDAGGDRTLTVSSTAAANEAIDMDVLTDQFSTISLTLADADSNVDIDLAGVDVIDINGAAALSTINNIVLTNTDAAFTYALSETGSSIAVTNIDMGTASALTISAASGGAGNITLANNAISIGTGALSLSAQGGNINSVADDGTAEISADGNVTLSAKGIGNTSQIEITGDASGNSSLTVDSKAAAGEAVNIDVLTDQFSAITLNLDDASSNVDIELPGVDVIDINGAAATSTLNNLVLTNTAPSFTFSLDEVATNISINNVDLSTGAFSATAQGGSITVAAAGGGIVATGASAITLVADGNGAQSLNINDAITSVGGAITLRAEDDIIFAAAGDVTSTNGNITVTADNDAQGNGSGGAITMNDGTLISAGTGTITMSADENITLGGLLTTNTTATAVTLTSTSGGIVDGGDTFVDISAAAGGASITTATGAGSANALETTLSSISASASGAGNIQINETNGITLTSLTTTNGSISVAAGGAVTATNVNASGAGASVTLTTTSGGMTLTNVLADNDITITADAGDLGLGVIGDAGTDDISLTATTGAMTDLNSTTNNITGDVLTLTSQGDIGSLLDPIEINVNSFTYTVGAGSTAYLAFSGSSNTVLDLSLSTGNLFFSSLGDMRIKRASALAGTVTLVAAGSIFAYDDNSVVNAYGDIRLTAGGTIGTVGRPLVVRSAAGHLYVTAGGMADNVSVNILGNLPRSGVTVQNIPPGLALYSGQILAGEAVNRLFPATSSLHELVPDFNKLSYPLVVGPGALTSFMDNVEYL